MSEAQLLGFVEVLMAQPQPELSRESNRLCWVGFMSWRRLCIDQVVPRIEAEESVRLQEA